MLEKDPKPVLRNEPTGGNLGMISNASWRGQAPAGPALSAAELPVGSRNAEGTQTRESEAMERLFIWGEVPSTHLGRGCQARRRPHGSKQPGLRGAEAMAGGSDFLACLGDMWFVNSGR